jgi:hypothetical protein
VIFLPTVGDRPWLQYLWNLDWMRSH